MRRRCPWSRDLGRGSADVGGASPCHNHNPDSWRSVLTNRAEGDIGGVPVTIGVLLYVSPTSSRDSACMVPTIPLLTAAPIPACVPCDTPGRTQAASVCNRPKSRRRWPYRPDDFLTGDIGGRNNHRIEVRRRCAAGSVSRDRRPECGVPGGTRRLLSRLKVRGPANRLGADASTKTVSNTRFSRDSRPPPIAQLRADDETDQPPHPHPGQAGAIQPKELPHSRGLGPSIVPHAGCGTEPAAAARRCFAFS
jgi:hypothetical protein